MMDNKKTQYSLNKRINRFLARSGLFSIRWIINHIPYGLYKFISFFFVSASRALLSKKRKTAMESLRFAYGTEKTEEELVQIADDVFDTYAYGMIHLIYYLDRPEEMKEKI